MANGECSGRILGRIREDKTMIGLGRFVLQSYEKSEFEVERSCTGYTARCMSRRMTKKAHQRQPSRRRTPVHRKKAQVSLCFFPIRKHYHSLLTLHLALFFSQQARDRDKDTKQPSLHSVPRTSHSIIPVPFKKASFPQRQL